MNPAISLPRTYVFSRSLRQSDYPDVTVVSDKVEEALRAEESNRISGSSGAALSFATFSTRV